MPSIEYESIYNRALTRMEDEGLANLRQSDFYEYLKEWLVQSTGDPYFRKKFSSFELDDDIEELTFELNDHVDDNYDTIFVTNMLAKGLIVNYLPSKLEKSDFLNAIVYGGDEKWKDNYKSAQTRLIRLQREFERDLCRHGYYFGEY